MYVCYPDVVFVPIVNYTLGIQHLFCMFFYATNEQILYSLRYILCGLSLLFYTGHAEATDRAQCAAPD